ncbi:MAG: ABC transporter permease [Rubrivivax sp.]|nr:ABC transporter permease [Pyrinomonadaceae bacterium]
MRTLWQDVRFALRMLWKNRGLTAVAVVALALGIGANSAIFSVVNAIVLRPLPFRDSERLVQLWGDIRQPGLEELELSAPEFTDFRERGGAIFESVAAYSTQGFNFAGAGEPERIQGAAVTASFFPTLGVEPIRGRTFTEEEDRPGADNVVVISHALWERRFGSDPQIAGKQVALDGRGYTVVGVMPASFHFPDNDAEIWKPIAFDADLLSPNNRGSHYLLATGRLRAGVPLERAQSEVAALAGGIGGDNPQAYPRGFGAKIRPLQEELVGGVRTSLFVLFGAVGLVLLIACANVASLLLARAASRRREMAVRTALGASRWRVIRQLLTESVLLSLAGGTAGLLLALWGIDVLVSLAPAGTPRVEEIGLDAGVVLFTFGVSLLTGVVFGLAPALSASKTDLNASLKEGSRGSTEGPRRARLRGLLVVAEFALALVLLAGAGLLVKSFARIQEVGTGFDPDGVLTMRLVLPEAKYKGYAEQRAFYETLFARLRALPGVESVGGNNLIPFGGGGGSRGFLIEGRPVPPGSPHPEEQLRFITAGYFDAMRIPVLRGRDFKDSDVDGAPRVAVVSRAMAERHWPDEEAIGKRFAYAGIGRGHDDKPDWIEIVGVVGDIKHRGLDVASKPEIYVPVYQPLFKGFRLPALYVGIRTSGDAASLTPAVRREVLAIDREQAVASMKTMRQRLAESIAQRRFNMSLLGLFAVVALVLAAVGVYGVMSYAVARRTHEIGVRVALGAQRGDVLRPVLRQGMRLTLAGVAVGLVGALAATRVLASLLYGVSATDPLTFAGVAALLSAVALFACLVPARRATKVDPMVALRYE